MKNKKDIQKPLNSKGAAIFKKMLEDKKTIHEYLQKGGKLSELKNIFHFANPLSFIRSK